MTITKLKFPSAFAVAAALSATMIAGCETIERETGLSRETQLGAGAGAAAGGLIALLSNANPAWVAASTILGGVAGGAISKYLTRNDAEMHASNQYQSLETLETGQTSRWSNPATGHSGYTTVTNVYVGAGGQTCKDFIEVIETPQRTVKENGTACRTPSGEWAA